MIVEMAAIEEQSLVCKPSSFITSQVLCAVLNVYFFIFTCLYVKIEFNF